MAGEQEIIIGDLKIRLRLDDSTVKAGVERNKRSAEEVSQSFEKAGKRIGVAIAAVTVAVAGAIGLALKRADDLGKAAQKIGVGVESLSRLEYAGRLADVSLETLTGSLGKLNRNLAEIKDGGGEAAKQTLDALGISVTDLDGKLRGADDVFTDIAEALSRMEEGPRKTAVAMDLFGRSGAQLLPLLNEGKAGLKELADEADRLGLTLDANTARGAERVNDALTRLWGAVQGVATRVGVALLPKLEETAAFFESEEFGNAVKDWSNIIIGGMNAIIQTAVSVTNALRGINDFFAADDQGLSDQGLKDQLAETDRAYATARAEYEKALGSGLSASSSEAGAMADRVMNLLFRVETLSKEVQRRKGEITGDDGGNGNKPGSVDYFEPDFTGGGDTGPTQEQLDARLEALRGALMSEMEMENSIYADRQEQLNDFLEREMLTKAEYDELWEKGEKDHWERVKEIRQEALSDLEKFNEMSWQDQAKTVFGELQSITEGVKHENDVLFNINKAAAVANAVINTYEGISKSLSAYPMPLAGIMAGVHAAAGFAQVQSILSTTRNTTGGSAKGLSGAAGAADGANSKAGAGADSSVMYVKGLDQNSLFTGGSIRTIAQGLLDFQRDGGKVVFTE